MGRVRTTFRGCLLFLAAILLLGGLLVVAVLVVPTPPPDVVDRSLDQALAPGVSAPGHSLPAKRISLDLEEGSFKVRAGEQESALRVEAEYDQTAYALELEEPEPDHFSLSFKRTMNFVQLLARARRGESEENRVDIYLPKDVPVELTVRTRKGEFRFDLSGVRLRTLDLDCAMGENRFEFNEPNPEPLERLRARAKMGEFRMSGLGHAGPRKLDVRMAMGENRLGFQGALPADSEALVSMRMGEVQLVIPDETRLQMAPASVLLGGFRSDRLDMDTSDPELEASGPSLSLSLNVLMGEARLR